MKKISFLFILSISFIFCLGQPDSLSFNSELNDLKLKGDPGLWQTHVISDKTSSLAEIEFSDKNSVYYFLVDSTFKIIDWYQEKKDFLTYDYYSDKFDVVLQSASGDIFRTYFLKKSSNEVFLHTPAFSSKISSFSPYTSFGPKEKFITAFEEKGHIYFVTHAKKSDKLRIYKDSAGAAQTLTLNRHDSLTDFDLKAALNEIAPVRESKEPDLLTLQGKTKVYIRADGSLALSIDNNCHNTMIWMFHLGDTAAEGRVLNKNPVYCNYEANEDAVYSNSFLCKDKILQAVLCHRELLIQLKEIANDSVLKEFHASRDSSISFASSGLIKKDHGKISYRGIFYHKQDTTADRSIKDLKAKDLFKAVIKSSLALLIVPQDDYLIIKTGEAHELLVASGGGGGGMYMPGGSFSTPGGSISTPGVWVSSGGGGYASKDGQSETYIMTILKRENMEFLPDRYIDTKYDRIDDMADRLKDISSAGANFDFNGKTWYFYWEKKTKRMLIKRVV